jgi:eukaryotic-like serine/threonine-protein kinase
METSAGTRVADPLVGRVIDGRYRIENRLARGGMATVYEATDLRLDRTVALKVMHASLAEDAAFVSRFVREAKSAARLSDQHVVAVYDQGEDDGVVYLVMEYVPGRTVRDVLREHGRLSGEQALTILDPVLQALDAAHRAGFVHRDIKPENVLLTDDGRVKVADFGLARAISAATSTAATQGLLIGTVAYLSPEQVERGIADARSDVYGAGILLYEMVTGAVPYAGETPLAVAYQHVNHEVPLPSSIRSDVPPRIDALVTRATQRDPDARFPDAESFLEEVRAARTSLPAPRPFGVREEPATAATLIVPLTDGAAAPPVNAAATGMRPAPPANAVRPKGPKRKRRKGPIALLVVLVIGALVAGGAWYYGVAKTVPMPSVVNMTPEKAQEKLTPDQLTLDSSQTDFSETVKAGQIISTDPRPGQDAREGTTVTAIVSKGPERYSVPLVAGQSVDVAMNNLQSGNLTVGKSTEAYSDKVGLGLVITTNPAPGVKLKRDQAVDLVVSKGPAPVKLPKLAGQTQAAATATLTKAGLKVTTSSDYSKTVKTGSVMSTSPGSGATVPKGSTVNLVISKGPPLTPVPDVYKMSEADAKARLRAAGFKVDVTYPIGITPFGRVVAQSVDAGKSIPWGSTIQIQVV